MYDVAQHRPRLPATGEIHDTSEEKEEDDSSENGAHDNPNHNIRGEVHVCKMKDHSNTAAKEEEEAGEERREWSRTHDRVRAGRALAGGIYGVRAACA